MIIVIRLFCLIVFVLGASGNVNAETIASESKDVKPVLQVFYKEKQPSLQTLQKIRTFLEKYKEEFTVRYLVITDPDNDATIRSLGLPTEHFPFALAINGKTSALIDGKKIVFAHFPDFMHHIGKHKGNWTLEHLAKVLDDTSLMLPDNPVVHTKPGGE